MGCGKCTVCRRDSLWLLRSSREGPTISRLWATWKRQPAFWAFVRGRCRRLQTPITELSLLVFNLSPQPHSCCIWFLKSTSPRSSFYRKSMAPPVPWIEGWWRKGLGVPPLRVDPLSCSGLQHMPISLAPVPGQRPALHMVTPRVSPVTTLSLCSCLFSVIWVNTS